MATHSSILAWRVPWTEEAGGLQSMGLQRVGHNWAVSLSFPGGALVKNLSANTRRCKRYRFDPWVWKIPWEGNEYLLQYSCLENSIDREVWWDTVYGVAKSQTYWATNTSLSYLIQVIEWKLHMSMWTSPEYDICIIKFTAKYSKVLVEGSCRLIFHVLFST